MEKRSVSYGVTVQFPDTGLFVFCRAQYDDSISSEDVISLGDIVSNVSKCSISCSKKNKIVTYFLCAVFLLHFNYVHCLWFIGVKE